MENIYGGFQGIDFIIEKSYSMLGSQSNPEEGSIWLGIRNGELKFNDYCAVRQNNKLLIYKINVKKMPVYVGEIPILNEDTIVPVPNILIQGGKGDKRDTELTQTAPLLTEKQLHYDGSENLKNSLLKYKLADLQLIQASLTRSADGIISGDELPIGGPCQAMNPTFDTLAGSLSPVCYQYETRWSNIPGGNPDTVITNSSIPFVVIPSIPNKVAIAGNILVIQDTSLFYHGKKIPPNRYLYCTEGAFLPLQSSWKKVGIGWKTSELNIYNTANQRTLVQKTHTLQIIGADEDENNLQYVTIATITDSDIAYDYTDENGETVHTWNHFTYSSQQYMHNPYHVIDGDYWKRHAIFDNQTLGKSDSEGNRALVVDGRGYYHGNFHTPIDMFQKLIGTILIKPTKDPS